MYPEFVAHNITCNNKAVCEQIQLLDSCCSSGSHVRYTVLQEVIVTVDFNSNTGSHQGLNTEIWIYRLARSYPLSC